MHPSANLPSHDHTASLLQLIKDLRQNRIDHLLDLILVTRTLLLLLLLLRTRILLLLRTGILLLLLLLMRVSIGARRILLLLLRVLLIVRMIGRRGSVHIRRTTSQIHINAPSVFLSRILKTKFLTDLLYSGLDLLDMVGRVVSFADDPIEWQKVG